MADNKFLHDGGCKEAVCIDAGRVYDSCADKDCAEDVQVAFTERDQQLIDCAINARVKKVEVLTTYIDVEALPFNRGYYSCDLTFFFEVTVEVFTGRAQPCTTVCGVAMFQKKVILFGSEGNVKVFCSELKAEGCDRQEIPSQNLPRCCVQVAEPVVLGSRLVDVRDNKGCCDCCCCCCGCIPECVTNRYQSRFVEPGSDGKALLVSLGIFSIVQLTRNVQMLVPVYDFCMPSKECCPTGDNPCDVFRKMSFPVDEFFPPKSDPSEGGCGCGCGR